MNLLSVQGEGAVYLLVLFLLCALIVHTVKLARTGYRTIKPSQKEQEKQPEQPIKQPSPEPVYYIVERKKKRQKSEYSKPKQIKFE